MQLSRGLQALSESATVALADRVRALTASGREIIPLQTGDPDFPTPPGIVEAAHKAMQDGWTHYAASRGLPELRKAIAEDLRRRCSAEYHPDTEILVTHGGVHAYQCALAAILNPDDEVLIPDPIWMTHVNTALMLGGNVIRVPSAPESGFLPPLEAWKGLVTSRSRAMVINYPCNPTGAVADRAYMQALVDLAARHDMFVVSDEVYNGILFGEGEHVPASSMNGAAGRVLIVNSLSKTYAMTGWRVGYLAGPREVVSQALKASQNSITNVAPFVQKAAIYALTSPDAARASREMAGVYRDRLERATGLFRDAPAGVGFARPGGAFYLFIDVRSVEPDSVKAANELLDEAGVAVVPGVVYGQCGEGFLRMTIAASEEHITEGIVRLLRWARRKSARAI